MSTPDWEPRRPRQRWPHSPGAGQMRYPYRVRPILYVRLRPLEGPSLVFERVVFAYSCTPSPAITRLWRTFSRPCRTRSLCVPVIPSGGRPSSGPPDVGRQPRHSGDLRPGAGGWSPPVRSARGAQWSVPHCRAEATMSERRALSSSSTARCRTGTAGGRRRRGQADDLQAGQLLRHREALEIGGGDGRDAAAADAEQAVRRVDRLVDHGHGRPRRVGCDGGEQFGGRRGRQFGPRVLIGTSFHDRASGRIRGPGRRGPGPCLTVVVRGRSSRTTWAGLSRG